MAAVFAAMLPALYAKLGEDATYRADYDDQAQTVRVIFDKGGAAALDGMLQTTEPAVRVIAASFPDGIPRGALFEIQGAPYAVREAALPMLDGAELRCPLALAEEF